MRRDYDTIKEGRDKKLTVLFTCDGRYGVGAIHAKSTNVGRGHLTDFIKNWSVGWDG